jgi:hypothetical protein
MVTDDLMADIIRSGVLALIGSRVARAIGEKDISEIISGTGWCIIGVDIIKILLPIAKAVSGFFKGIADFADKVEGFFSSDGILYKILSFGAKKW